MKKNKFEIAIIVFMLVFSGILFGLYLVYDVYTSYLSYTLIMSPYTVLDCKVWDCKNLSSNLENFNNKEYSVYIDGVDKGVNSIYYNRDDKKFYVFDKNNNNLYRSGKLFGYNSQISIKQLNFSEDEVATQDINKLMKLVDKQLVEEDVVKISLDFDFDGKTESIYTINKQIIDGKKFSFLIYYDGKNFSILDQEESEDVTDVSNGYISNVINIFDDEKLEFIYTKEYFSDTGSCNVIYRLKKHKFEKVNDCEIVQ